jgi:glucosamine 6-phosphate synthetase-like amidotransferase/phosphosugar isomerase protein
MSDPARDPRLDGLMHEPSTDAAGDFSRLTRVARSREEMLAQAPAITRTLAESAVACLDIARRTKNVRRVVIAGCGDSWLAGLSVRLAWERLLGIPMEAAQALDYAGYAVETADASTLVIGISASGKTEAVIESLSRARARGAMTVGVSNAPGAATMAACDAALVVHATRRGWPTQSSTATMALLCRLASAIAAARGVLPARTEQFDRDLAAVPELVEDVTAAADKPMREIAESFCRAEILTFLGAGPHYGAAAIGAAKVREFGPIHAQAMPLEEFHHYRLQKPGDHLFLLAPDGASHARALDAAMVGKARAGHTVALLPRGEASIASHVERAVFLPEIRAELAPIVYSVPLHLFAYHFTQACEAAGIGYDSRFRFPAESA